jgi:hypothetical protein
LKGEKEGYIAILELKELKAMQKRDPTLAFQISKMCGKLCLETVTMQYEGSSVLACEVKNEVAEISKNKMMDMLIGCPGFGPFFSGLEKKDKRFIVNICDIVEIKSEKKVIGEYSPAHSIIIILKGELISFTKSGPGKTYKAGDILGIKEVLFDLCWKDNFFGRQNGYLVKIQKDLLNDLGNSFSKSAMNIFDHLIKYECGRIRGKYKDVKPTLPGNSLLGGLGLGEDDDLKDEENGNEKVKYVELFVNQNQKSLHGSSDKLTLDKDILEPFKINRDVPPLMIHAVFKTIKKQDLEAEKLMENERKAEKMSTFLREKMENQYLEDKKRRRELAMRKKKGLPFDHLLPEKAVNSKAQPKGPGTLEALEVEYDTLKNEYNLLELGHEELKAKFEEVMRQLKSTEDDVKRLKERNIYVTAERDRQRMHKELVSKMAEVEDGESFASKFRKNRVDQVNFNDVVIDC